MDCTVPSLTDDRVVQMKLEKPSKMMKKLLKKRAPTRRKIDTRPNVDRKKAGHRKQMIEESKNKNLKKMDKGKGKERGAKA